MTYAQQFGKDLIELTKKSGDVMTEDQAKSLVCIALIDTHGDNEGLDEVLEKDFIYNVIKLRIQVMLPGVKVDLPLMLFLTTLSLGNPGNAVMLTTVVAYLASVHGRELMLSDLIDVFPFKVPTQDVFSQMWDKQKRVPPFTGGDNELDIAANWKEEKQE